MSFTGYITYISKRTSLNVIQAPFFFCCFVSVFLYFFAITDALPSGAYTAVALGFILFIFCLYKKWLSINTFNKNSIEYFLFVVPFCVLYFAIARDFKFLGWDEFSFWASSQKLIYKTGALYKEHSPIFFKSYPPAQQLFQYYLTKMTFWSEKNVLFAQIFWVLSGLMCIAGTLIKRPLHAAISFLTSCAFIYFFNFSFSSVYSDLLLGITFAVCVALAYKNNVERTSTLALFLSMATLMLIKEIGIFLALVALSISFINRCLEKNTTSDSFYKKLLSASVSTLGLAGGLFVVMKSWSWYLGTINAIRPVKLPLLADFSVSPLRDRTVQTVTEFVTRTLKPGYLTVADASFVSSPSIIAFALGMIFISTVLLLITNFNDRLKILSTTSLLALGALAYTAVLLFSYLVLFTEYESVRLASFERYLSTYTIAWFLILYTLLYAELFLLNNKTVKILQAIIIGLVVYFVPKLFFHDIRKIESVGPVNDLRVSIDNFASLVKKHITFNEKVYFIAQKSNGLERAIFNYSMLPYSSSTEWCWSLGEKYFDGDVWTCNMPLESVLKGYTYLALYSADAQFWKINSSFFDQSVIGTNSGVFKINRNPDSTIKSFTKID